MRNQFAVAAAVLLIPASAALAQTTRSKPPQLEPITVTVRPWGPAQAELDAARERVTQHPQVTAALEGSEYRLLGFDLLDSLQPSQPPDRFKASFFDYTNNRTIVAIGSLRSSEVVVGPSAEQPHPSEEEFAAAVAVLERDEHLGPPLAAGELKPYRPMPATIEMTDAGSVSARTVAVGLFPSSDMRMHEIVGVTMKSREIIRFAAGAPPTAQANARACGLPSAGQGTTPRGTAGQFQITITQGPATVWSMLAIRPSVSSGTRASGIEVRDVDYRGKRVLKRGHVPILNVEYTGNACGPYRDWQWQEGYFYGVGTQMAPGVFSCPEPAQTILENGNDLGTIRGFAYYVLGSEVVLVTELEAGWYRYISEWRFDMNGTIRPRFRFGGVNSSCVCNEHVHHAYFRLDFDIAGEEKNLFSEVNARDFVTPQKVETKRFRVPVGNRRWTVENTGTGDKYLIQPRHEDGFADTYGRGDVWLLRYHTGGTPLTAELDDGYNSTGGNGTPANLDMFVNGESIENQDVVMWYGGHSLHDEDAEEVHVPGAVGPDIIPVRWTP
jgi:hypothetical protein